MDFKELYLSFTHESHTHTLKGIHVGSPKIISSYQIEKLLKKGHYGVLAQFNTLQVLDNPSSTIHHDFFGTFSNTERGGESVLDNFTNF